MKVMGVGEFLLHLFVCVQGMREKVRKGWFGEAGREEIGSIL